MEEKNEILAVMKEGFERIDQRFARVDQQFERIDQRFEHVDQQFARVDEQFLTLRREFSEQLDGLSDGLHLELKAQVARLEEKIGGIGVDVEKVDAKIGLLGENVANVMTQLRRYNATVEVPLEKRVTHIEERVLALEQKK